MKLLAALVLAGLISVAFAGCVNLFDEVGDAGGQSIAKKVLFSFDQRTMEDDDPSFEDLVKTSFEYTHHGASVKPADVEVEFLGANGSPRTVGIALYTTADEIKDGDVVTITGANFTSGLTVRKGGDVLAQRGGIDADWFTAEAVPIPLTSTQAGVAQYQLKSSSGFKFDGDGIDADGTRITDALADVKGTMDGSLEVRTTQPSAGPRLEASANLVGKLEALAEATVAEADKAPYQVGVRTENVRAELEGLVSLQFDRAHQLTKTGGSNRVFADGHFYVWDEDHSKASNYEPEDMDHPFADESSAYTEESIDEPGEPAPQWVVEFFERLWSMEIGVGDDYRMHLEFGMSDWKLQFDYVVQVVDEEVRKVGGDSFDTYRISHVGSIELGSAKRGDSKFDLIHGDYWISRESYLPVYAQTTMTRSFTRDEAQRFFDAFDEESGVKLPDDFTLALTGEQTIQLTGYSGDLQVGPIAGLMLGNPSTWGMTGGPFSIFAMGIGRASASENWEEPPRPAMQAMPMIGWMDDESADTIIPTQVPSSVSWGEIGIKLGGDTTFPVQAQLNGGDLMLVSSDFYSTVSYDEMQAGDSLHFCADAPQEGVEIWLLHFPTNAILHQYEFQLVGLC